MLLLFYCSQFVYILDIRSSYDYCSIIVGSTLTTKFEGGLTLKRQDKYPDTDTFHFYNANPKGRITGDCVYRAIATATETHYHQVIRDLAEMAIKTGYSPASKECYGKYLESKGWVKHKQPKKWDNTKYTGKEFCKELMRYDSEIDSGNDLHHIVAHIGGHHIVAIISGQVWDIWNSTDGCIGNYWTK